MIHYKTITVTVPANGEGSDVIYSVPEGKKIQLRSLGHSNISNVNMYMDIHNNRFVDVPGDFFMYMGYFIPLAGEVDGPVDISVGGKDSTGANNDITFCLVYED